MNEYQSILNGIFVCGLPAVNRVIEKEQAQVVVDVRVEVDETEARQKVATKYVPLVDGKPNQAALLQEAIAHVVTAYQEGKKIVLH
ncbi:hypothetical protein [Halalkalibacter akibai]|uniref:Uncharacterized protein n=1 Tax=Halalkalibacter akibai (strain ATCC 43226 / DSM 21942 / CIP 109018 / JCM 9157 / 1139) TaxID=1236973 RepID=W4QZE5_HALA3|nr:hypothetical protein [Halalkalibacter akibai]GAE37287.1 hypothetical protein JCM9157_4560 [Halalkalibacter akibai JCM 9157]